MKIYGIDVRWSIKELLIDMLIKFKLLSKGDLYMSKIVIALNILDILLDENLHKAKEIAEKIEISESAVRWYINELLCAGCQIESIPGRKGGYKLDKGNSANRVYKLIHNN